MSQELQELLLFRIPIGPIAIPSLVPTENIYSVDCKKDFDPAECKRVGVKQQLEHTPQVPVAQFLRKYRNNTACLLYEAPLKQFYRWFFRLPLQKVFDPKACVQPFGDPNGTDFRWLTWDYRIVFLKPSSGVNPNDVRVQDLKWAQEKLRGFYRRTFNHSLKEDLVRIQQSIENDQSIIIIAFRYDGSPPKSVIRVEKFAILAAVTFCHGKSTRPSEACCVRVSLIAVSKTTNRAHPENIQEWRHLRFGSFMLLSVIKLCVCVGGTKETIVLYSHCSDAATRSFYQACGFQTLSKGNKELPPSLHDSVLPQVSQDFYLLNGR